MKASEILRKNVNALMQQRGWTANKQLIAASDNRLSNGTLGRLRSDEGENVRLNVVDELGQVFGVAPHELLAPTGMQPGYGTTLADGRTWRDLMLEAVNGHPDEAFLREFIGHVDTAFRSGIEARRATRHTLKSEEQD